MKLGRYGRNPGWAFLAIFCMLYGVGVAACTVFASSGFAHAWTLYGSFACGVLFLALMVIPYLLWQFGPQSTSNRAAGAKTDQPVG